MQLVQFQQESASGVLLNEPLVFHFSEELDPASVSVGSARVVDSAGRLVPGEYSVEGSRLVFQPRLAHVVNLSDGGFLPGTRLSVELSGFPSPSGLRSRTGRLLEQSFSGSFDVIESGRVSALFIDSSPDVAHPLFLANARIGLAEAIRVVCPEALDPRSLRQVNFQLRRYQPDSSYEEIRLQARLAENRGDTGAVIELRALDDTEPGVPRSLEPGDYHLWISDESGGLVDLGGHPVRSAWAARHVPVSIHVEQKGEQLGNRSMREDFLSLRLSSPAAAPGVDGAATWGADGMLRMRFPLSAGSGAQGAVQLGVSSLADLKAVHHDLHSSSLTLAEDRIFDLSSVEGVVALRSQTSLLVDGRLVRRSLDSNRRRHPGEAWGAWFDRVGPGVEWGDLSSGRPQTFAAWLGELQAAQSETVVMVAGGDLWVGGDISVDGPLVLVAGGRIRISGRIEASEVWLVGLGGGADIHPLARGANLPFGEPSGNPLVNALRLGVVSAPIRPLGKEVLWRRASIGMYPGAGSVRVRFLGERESPDGRIEEVGPVDDVALLDRCEAVRIWIELEIQPGAAWDPPMVDFVELHWTEETAP